MKRLIKYTAEERAEIIAALKVVAVAEAHLWDVLRDGVEARTGISVEYDDAMIGDIAGDCVIPAENTVHDPKKVWAAFMVHSREVA
jgi:hypothetical protein